MAIAEPEAPELGDPTGPVRVKRNKDYKPKPPPVFPERPTVETVLPENGGMPLRLITVRLDDDGYPGWWVKARINLRLKQAEDYVSGQTDRVFPALRHIIHAWNWVDEDAQPLPLPRERDTFDDWIVELPDGLVNVFLARYGEQRQAALEAPKASATPSGPG